MEKIKETSKKKKEQKGKVRGPNVKALLIYRDIQRIVNEALKRLEANVGNYLKRADIDRETAKVLKNVHFNKPEYTVEDRIKQLIDPLSKEIRAKKQGGVDKIFLTLSSEGELYREPKEKYYYPIRKSGMRFKILSFLIGQKYFIYGPSIAEETKTSYGSLTFSIRRINEIARKTLHLPVGKNYNLIISKPREGYKLNPIYPISLEE